MKRWPEVVQCATVTGAADYELRIVTRDMHAFDDFLRDKILSLGLVSNIESRIVIRSVKNATTVPLGPGQPPCGGEDLAPGARPHDRTRHRAAPARPGRLRGRRACCRSPSVAWSGRSCSSTTWARPTFAAGLPRSVDVRPHPHIGLSTVTYLFEGEIMHRDSVGSETADPAGRGQLDDRRARHHPLRALRTAAPRGRTDARHPGLGRAARRRTRRPTRVPPSRARGPADL